MLAQASKLNWVLKDYVDPNGSDMFDMVLHADKVGVVFPHYLRHASYYGYIAKDSPAEWATELAKTLEPCWKPAPHEARPWATS